MRPVATANSRSSAVSLVSALLDAVSAESLSAPRSSESPRWSRAFGGASESSERSAPCDSAGSKGINRGASESSAACDSVGSKGIKRGASESSAACDSTGSKGINRGASESSAAFDSAVSKGIKRGASDSSEVAEDCAAASAEFAMTEGAAEGFSSFRVGVPGWAPACPLSSAGRAGEGASSSLGACFFSRAARVLVAGVRSSESDGFDRGCLSVCGFSRRRASAGSSPGRVSKGSAAPSLDGSGFARCGFGALNTRALEAPVGASNDAALEAGGVAGDGASVIAVVALALAFVGFGAEARRGRRLLGLAAVGAPVGAGVPSRVRLLGRGFGATELVGGLRREACPRLPGALWAWRSGVPTSWARLGPSLGATGGSKEGTGSSGNSDSSSSAAAGALDRGAAGTKLRFALRAAPTGGGGGGGSGNAGLSSLRLATRASSQERCLGLRLGLHGSREPYRGGWLRSPFARGQLRGTATARTSGARTRRRRQRIEASLSKHRAGIGGREHRGHRTTSRKSP